MQDKEGTAETLEIGRRTGRKWKGERREVRGEEGEAEAGDHVPTYALPW
jgi:hypothetical protein